MKRKIGKKKDNLITPIHNTKKINTNKRLIEQKLGNKKTKTKKNTRINQSNKIHQENRHKKKK